MKAKYVIATIIIAVFLVFGAISLKNSLTPYVSFAQAQKGGTVQIIGKLVPGTDIYDPQSEKLTFSLIDHKGKERMQIYYQGVKPGNFDQATEIVAIGQVVEGNFQANDLLVKCPSKYQGLEEKKPT